MSTEMQTKDSSDGLKRKNYLYKMYEKPDGYCGMPSRWRLHICHPPWILCKLPDGSLLAKRFITVKLTLLNSTTNQQVSRGDTCT